MENNEANNEPEPNHDVPKKPEFKKPVLLVGKIGKLPKKIKPISAAVEIVEEPPSEVKTDAPNPVEDAKDKPINLDGPITDKNAIPYKEPVWSGMPLSSNKEYVLEVLKNGSIIERINLMDKPFWVFGRLLNCDVTMQHPTISRYHAVLQFREESTETEGRGFYIYDLGSTHGTFLNKNKLRHKIYVRTRVGHMLKFGTSTRSYILNGPDEDAEAESEYSVTELKQRRADEIKRREEAAIEAKLKKERDEEERRKKEEARGVDWGMGEDADEETDLSENPFAQTNNEELYLDDPKKALRGFFEREGLNLEYECSEQGMGQFLCKVELPVDDERGRAIKAEVLHKGKKKEAVIQCALEACRILDRHGVLRQAVHESRKRKAKNWEENDYYDSDEDTFLDRTGAIEKKRERRMNEKLPQKAETYESLMEKEKALCDRITTLEMELQSALCKQKFEQGTSNEEDSLDSFMKELKKSKPDKHSITKIKAELFKLKQEHIKIIKLVNIARPASLPPLVASYSLTSTTGVAEKKPQLPIFGKRKMVKVNLPARPTQTELDAQIDNDIEEEELEEDNEENSTTKIEIQPVSEADTSSVLSENKDIMDTSENCEEAGSSSSVSKDVLNVKVAEESQIDSTKIETPTTSHLARGVASSLNTVKSKYGSIEKYKILITKMLKNLKNLAEEEDRIKWDWKLLLAKKRKVLKFYDDLKSHPEDDKLANKASTELNNIIHELTTMSDARDRVNDEFKKMSGEIKLIQEEISNDLDAIKVDLDNVDEDTLNASLNKLSEESENSKKKKKNLKRIQHRQEKAEHDKQKGYDEDAKKEDYCMWVPPSGQEGDGKTSLNEKFGY